MKLIKSIIIILSFLSLVACANANRMNSINIGMTKQQVMNYLGCPDSTSAKGGVQYLKYNLYTTDAHAWYGITEDYYVRIVNGKVDSFGKFGDFDSTQTNEVINSVNFNIKRN